eukprot:4491864-Pleurochrysis_carterae.AAC.1
MVVMYVNMSYKPTRYLGLSIPASPFAQYVLPYLRTPLYVHDASMLWAPSKLVAWGEARSHFEPIVDGWSAWPSA